MGDRDDRNDALHPPACTHSKTIRKSPLVPSDVAENCLGARESMSNDRGESHHDESSPHAASSLLSACTLQVGTSLRERLARCLCRECIALQPPRRSSY